MNDPTPNEPAPAATYSEILASLGLPPDAKAVVLTPDASYAIAADYPEPYTPPTEEDPDARD